MIRKWKSQKVLIFREWAILKCHRRAWWKSYPEQSPCYLLMPPVATSDLFLLGTWIDWPPLQESSRIFIVETWASQATALHLTEVGWIKFNLSILSISSPIPKLARTIPGQVCVFSETGSHLMTACAFFSPPSYLQPLPLKRIFTGPCGHVSPGCWRAQGVPKQVPRPSQSFDSLLPSSLACQALVDIKRTGYEGKKKKRKERTGYELVIIVASGGHMGIYCTVLPTNVCLKLSRWKMKPTIELECVPSSHPFYYFPIQHYTSMQYLC